MMKVQEWMKQVHPTTQRPRSRQNVGSRERGIHNDDRNFKRLQALLSQQVERTKKDDETNRSVAGKATAIPRLSIY
jgi:hypothetical protein